MKTIRSRYATPYILVLCAFAFTACQDPLQKVQVVSGYCEQYRRAITAPVDATALQSLPRPLRERLAANEATYRCLCTGWQNPVCQNDANKK